MIATTFPATAAKNTAMPAKKTDEDDRYRELQTIEATIKSAAEINRNGSSN